MTAISAMSNIDVAEGFPLDIAPLLSPYLQQGKLSIRIERLPPRSRLSKGRNNGDATFSLKPNELNDVFFLPAEDADGSAITLAIRIVKLDGDYATTLALIDLPVSPGQDRELSTGPQALIAERPSPDARETNRKAAQLSVGALRKSRQSFPGKPAGEQVETRKLRRALDVLTKSLAETEARAEHAERMAEEAEARLADYETGAADAEPETAVRELEAANAQALKAAAAAHARDLEQAVEAAKEQMAAEFDGRLATATRAAEEMASNRLEKERQGWESEAQTALATARETWKGEEAQRFAAARKAFEAELSDLREQFTAATDDIEAARRQATEIAATSRAREIAELRATHERALEDNTAATKAAIERSFEDRLAEERDEAKRAAELRLSDERKKWEADAAACLLKANEAWQAEEAKRRTEATVPLEGEISDLRQQLKTAGDEIAKVREQVSTDTETWRLREIEELQRTHASDLEATVDATKKQLEQEFAGRLSNALRGADDKAEARLAEKKTEHEAELSALRAQLNAAADEIAALRKPGPEASEVNGDRAGEAGAAAVATVLDQGFEDRLVAERKVWEASAEATLAKARANWKAAEKERLAVARKAWQKEVRMGRRPGRGISGRRRYNIRATRRSLVIAAVFVGLFALPLLKPDIKLLILKYAAPAITEIKTRVAPLLESAIGAVQPPQPQATSLVERNAIVGVASANVRSRPSTASNVLVSLSLGSAVTLLEARGNWLRIRFGAGAGDVGWVHRDLLGDPF